MSWLTKAGLRAFVTFTITLAVVVMFCYFIIFSVKDVKITGELDISKISDVLIYAFLLVLGYLFGREKKE
jgi:TRAP-type C4-dicarboxylate transport system permease small subunit